jgi:hypothetical protein
MTLNLLEHAVTRELALTAYPRGHRGAGRAGGGCRPGRPGHRLLIPAGHWAAYLGWFRRVTALPVRNGAAVTAITPRCTDDGLPCLHAGLSTGETLQAHDVPQTDLSPMRQVRHAAE